MASSSFYRTFHLTAFLLATSPASWRRPRSVTSGRCAPGGARAAGGEPKKIPALTSRRPARSQGPEIRVVESGHGGDSSTASHVRADASTHRGAGPSRRRDRRALGSPRRRHRPAAGPAPRVRRPRRLGGRRPLLRRVAELASRTGSGRGARARAGGPGAGRVAAALGGPGARRAVLLQGPGADAGGHAGDRGAAAGGGAGGDGGPRGEDRAGMAVRGPAGGGPGREGPPSGPVAPGLHRRGRDGGRARAAQRPRRGPSSSGRSKPPGRRSTSRGRRPTPRRARSPTRRPSASSRRTRWRWWRRRRSSRGSVAHRRASATRSSSTWTPRCWPTPLSRASRSWRTACAFPRKRPAAWRARRPGWSCATRRTARCSTWGGGRGRSRRRYAGRWRRGTAGAASRAARSAAPRAITSITGPTAARPGSTTSPFCAAGTPAVHEEGYTVVRNTDGTLRFSTPGGWPIPDVPAPPPVPREPMPPSWRRTGRTGS